MKTFKLLFSFDLQIAVNFVFYYLSRLPLIKNPRKIFPLIYFIAYSYTLIKNIIFNFLGYLFVVIFILFIGKYELLGNEQFMLNTEPFVIQRYFMLFTLFTFATKKPVQISTNTNYLVTIFKVNPKKIILNIIFTTAFFNSITLFLLTLIFNIFSLSIPLALFIIFAYPCLKAIPIYLQLFEKFTKKTALLICLPLIIALSYLLIAKTSINPIIFSIIMLSYIILSVIILISLIRKQNYMPIMQKLLSDHELFQIKIENYTNNNDIHDEIELVNTNLKPLEITSPYSLNNAFISRHKRLFESGIKIQIFVSLLALIFLIATIYIGQQYQITFIFDELITLRQLKIIGFSISYFYLYKFTKILDSFQLHCDKTLFSYRGLDSPEFHRKLYYYRLLSFSKLLFIPASLVTLVILITNFIFPLFSYYDLTIHIFFFFIVLLLFSSYGISLYTLFNPYRSLIAENPIYFILNNILPFIFLYPSSPFYKLVTNLNIYILIIIFGIITLCLILLTSLLIKPIYNLKYSKLFFKNKK